MRRLATALIATSLLLAGCGGGDDPETEPTEDSATPAPSDDGAVAAEPTAEDIAALEAVTVEGELGAAPQLVFEQPFDVSVPVARVETEGDGPAIEDGQQVKLHYVAVAGDTGEPLAPSTWEAGEPETLTVGEEGIVTALTDALLEATVGSRIVFASPSAEAVPATDTLPETPARAATVMAIEVIEATTVPTRAEGAAVEPAPGLPVVTLAENGEPEIEIPAGTEKPTELVVQPLIQGEGDEVQTGDQVTVHYKGWTWDGTLFDSSWEGDPFPTPIGTGQLIAGWDTGLVGQKVGSQVLLVIPPELGYGAEGMGDIPPDSTLVFVIDILATS